MKVAVDSRGLLIEDDFDGLAPSEKVNRSLTLEPPNFGGF